MKKLVIAFCLIVTLTFVCCGASFSDVAENAWYCEYVDKASDDGIVKGMGGGLFSPDGNFTVAQCLAVASRIHASHSGNALDETAGESWFSPYVDYCVKNGIVTGDFFDSYTRPVTREEAAYVLYACADKNNLEQINTVNGIADVPKDDGQYEAIAALYRAGVLAGSDDAGSFMPKTHIKRSELSAVAVRLAFENYRIKRDFPYYGYARYLIDDSIMYGPDNGIMSGWKLDDKYRINNTSGRDSATVSAGVGQKNALYRPLNKVKGGNARFDIIAAFSMTKNGGYVSLDDDKEQSVISVKIENSRFVAVSGDNRIDTGVKVNPSVSEHNISFDVSFEKNSADIIIDDVTVFDVPFDAENISRLSVGFDGSGSGSATVGFARGVADYRVNENFIATERTDGARLYGRWKTEGLVEMSEILSERGRDVYSARMTGKSDAGISFEKIGALVCAEANVLLPDASSKMTFSVLSGEDTALEIRTADGGFYLGETFLRKVAENVWTNIRLEIDFAEKTVFVRINGKDCRTHAFSAKTNFADKVKISLEEGKTAWFDDVKVFSLYNHDDYPEKPVAVNDDGYEIGVNVCNLWRNGNCGEGYDAVAPFEELYPYVGLADEGTPELADWEIKQMSEHGIDFQHICWYSPRNETTAPVKGIHMPQTALNDGYLKSKYGEYVKFCIMWENANGSVTSRQQFEDYIWPYFKEYYLSDSRYYSIDNKAVITIWRRDALISSFGGVKQAREVVEFMKEDVKSLGYDGLIVWFSGDSSVSETVAALGGDATYAYNYGRSGEHADFQIATMKQNKDSGKVYYVPAVSVGFNAIGRHDERSGMITPKEHERVCEYIKNEYLPSENDGSWHDNLFIVSTWNEYTEGTYVAPSNLYGFAYLDNVRRVFTGAAEDHEDVVPDETVKDRLRSIYPDGYSPIRRYRLETGTDEFDPSKTKAVVSWDFSTVSAKNDWHKGHGLSSFGFSENTLYGSSDVNDFAVSTRYEDSLGVDAGVTGARYLHIRMKSDVISRGEMFFITNSIPNYVAEASVTWDVIKTDEFVDYYVDCSQNVLWSGIVTGLRIDPMMNAGNFEIELIELLCGDKTDSADIVLDGNVLRLDFAPEYNEKLDDYMITLNPRLGFFSLSHTYYEYDVDKKTFYIESFEGNVLFTVGSDKAIVNGKEEKTGFTFVTRDGLPLVPVKYLMKKLGFTLKEKPGALHFATYDEKTALEVSKRREGEWEFDSFRDGEGWIYQNCTGFVYDGKINAVATGVDTAVKNMNLNIPLEKYSRVTVGLSYRTTAINATVQVFFQTKAMSTMNEAASKKIGPLTNNTNGEVVELVFDFSDNPDWFSTLTGLRIDPYHGLGEYSIDYVRLS